ncbi:MAG: aminopeptidase P family protein [Mycetocola sp.]
MTEATSSQTSLPDETAAENRNRSTTPSSTAFQEFIGSGWADREETVATAAPVAAFTAARRDVIASAFEGKRVVVAAGSLKPRNNDCDYPFRAHSAFAHLTGWGSASEPDSLLVIDTRDGSRTDTLYFRGPAGRDSTEFYANATIGEFWIGARPSAAQVATELGISTAELSTFTADPADVTLDDADGELLRISAELRLVKDSFEIAELRSAVAATASGFADVVSSVESVIGRPRGERLVEGVFSTRARLDGNQTGYDTIAASGAHACILHWTRNDGQVNEGELILIDAGVEVDSLYTADITRTIPVSGTFSPVQRKVYEAVLEAADAALRITRPGIRFHEVHQAAMEVIARKTAEWGLLPVSAEESLKPELQYHRRYMVHGTSHHLGLDVHDCAQARREMYYDGVVEEGMVFTIEPGLYFQPDDLTVPEELRGIGVRIEDDILVTADGAENLSAGIPRSVAEVEAWLAG